MHTSKQVTVELRFFGTGAVIEKPRGRFTGGVPEPELGALAGFSVVREERHEAGHLSPPLGEDSYLGALQVNFSADSAGFRELGRYFLALAELDTSADPGFHQHHELISEDRRTQVHLIVRKPCP